MMYVAATLFALDALYRIFIGSTPILEGNRQQGNKAHTQECADKYPPEHWGFIGKSSQPSVNQIIRKRYCKNATDN